MKFIQRLGWFERVRNDKRRSKEKEPRRALLPARDRRKCGHQVIFFVSSWDKTTALAISTIGLRVSMLWRLIKSKASASES